MTTRDWKSETHLGVSHPRTVFLLRSRSPSGSWVVSHHFPEVGHFWIVETDAAESLEGPPDVINTDTAFAFGSDHHARLLCQQSRWIEDIPAFVDIHEGRNITTILQPNAQ